jgi:hypothetical protein
MENYITCPNCKTKITNDPLIETALQGAGNGTQGVDCACGATINYWDITEQLRAQKTLGKKVSNWWQTFMNQRS